MESVNGTPFSVLSVANIMMSTYNLSEDRIMEVKKVQEDTRVVIKQNDSENKLVQLTPNR